MPCLEYGLAVVDALLSLFVFFPLSILHWRGTWQLQDVYFKPDNLTDSSWISFGLGLNLCLIELLCQPLLKKYLDPQRKVIYFIVTRLHLYIHGWAVMFYWRGLWNLMDYYLTEGWVNSAILYGICQVITMLVCVSRTNVGIPVSVSLDTDPDILEPDTVFKVSPDRSVLFLLDCMFAQIVIVTCNIVVWRGIWNLIDKFLLPRHHVESDIISLIVGYGFLGLMFLLQWPTSAISASLDGCPKVRLIFEDIIFLIAEWANLLLWRGGWDLCVKYVIPDPLVGSWISHIVGTIGLISLQVFSNVGLNGIERDNIYENGEGIYPTKYLRVYLEHKFKKKTKSNKTYHNLANGSVISTNGGSGRKFELVDSESDSDDSVFGIPVINKDEDKMQLLPNGNGNLQNGVHEAVGFNETAA